MWTHLNYHDLPDDDPAYSDARRRVLGRLGEYVAQVVAPLNMRPRSATLLFEDANRVEVRISTSSTHVVLVIAPDGDLAAEVFFLRSCATKNLPVPRLVGHDLSCGVVPFTYALVGYVAGAPLSRIDDGPLMRVAARQLGRTLRRVHLLPAAGFGRPTTTGRWPARGWREILESWLARRGGQARVVEALGEEQAAALWAATVRHPALACHQPSVVHGAVEPGRALVTIGDSAQLEALVRPGETVGGDPMFDLAYGLLPCRQAAFRQGLLEGYTASGPLSAEQENRLRRLKLLLHVTEALGGEHSESRQQLPELVADALVSLSDTQA